MSKFFKSLFQQAAKTTSSKRIVGKDHMGNVYYELSEAPGQPPRRLVEYYDAIPNPTAVPRIWWSWMSYRMDKAPTPEEIAAEDRRVATMQAKVKKLEAADAKLRLQEIADGMHDNESAKAELSMESMMQQMKQNEKKQH